MGEKKKERRRKEGREGEREGRKERKRKGMWAREQKDPLTFPFGKSAAWRNRKLWSPLCH